MTSVLAISKTMLGLATGQVVLNHIKLATDIAMPTSTLPNVFTMVAIVARKIAPIVPVDASLLTIFYETWKRLRIMLCSILVSVFDIVMTSY